MLDAKVLHGPAEDGECDSCHTLSDPKLHSFELTSEKGELCLECHDEPDDTVVHKPVAEGECTGCHDPHGSPHAFMLLGDPAGDLCLRCHPVGDFRRKAYVHGPVAVKACSSCHRAHGSAHEALLVKPGKELCFDCHADVQAQLKSISHLHQPVAQGSCLACHHPHASDVPAQLRAAGPALCYTCHEHDNIKKLVESSSRVHGPVTTGKACAACHAAHGGAMPKLLAVSPMKLCLSCHDKPVETRDGRTIADIATVLKSNPSHHGPIEEEDCTACHDPHASPHFALLAMEYPEAFYAPFDTESYDLCFSCHSEEAMTEAEATDVTGFRDNDRNLHLLHVNKAKKGRTCRVCHEVHASKGPFQLREKVPFGPQGWELDVKFQPLPNGGRCAPACHWEKTYSRVPAPEPTTRPAASSLGPAAPAVP